jgi:hypothetical protein
MKRFKKNFSFGNGSIPNCSTVNLPEQFQGSVIRWLVKYYMYMRMENVF